MENFACQGFIGRPSNRIDRQEEHYCGPVFMDRTRNEENNSLLEFRTPSGVNLTRNDVLDGQQRITTIMLIAAALAKNKSLMRLMQVM